MAQKGMVSTIVLNWNGKDIIEKCLQSLIAQTYRPHEIILVDNGSTDGSLQSIEQKYQTQTVSITCSHAGSQTAFSGWKGALRHALKVELHGEKARPEARVRPPRWGVSNGDEKQPWKPLNNQNTKNLPHHASDTVIKIICNPVNAGFAEGINIGVRHSEGEFIALLNSDAIADPKWLEEMIDAIGKSESVGMCACKVYLDGRPGILDNTGELLCRDGLNRTRGRLEHDRGQYDSSEDVLCPSGCAALYRRKMMEEISGFDKRFFAYGDDMDLGLRGRMAGYGSVYAPKAVAYHRLSASAGLWSSFKAYYIERNRLWIVLRCFPLRHLLSSPLVTLQRYYYNLYGIVTKRGPASQFAQKSPFSSLTLVCITLKVYLSTLLFLPYLLNERRKIREKSKWGYAEFEACFRRYGISAKDATLNEVL